MSTETEAKQWHLMSALINTLGTIEKRYSSDPNIADEASPPDSFTEYVPDGFYDKDLEEISAMSDETVRVELADLGYDDAALQKNINALTIDNVFVFKNKREATDSAMILQSNLMSELIREAIGKSFIYSRKDTALSLSYSEPVKLDYVAKTQAPATNVLSFFGRRAKRPARDDHSSRAGKFGKVAGLVIVSGLAGYLYASVNSVKTVVTATAPIVFQQVPTTNSGKTPPNDHYLSTDVPGAMNALNGLNANQYKPTTVPHTPNDEGTLLIKAVMKRPVTPDLYVTHEKAEIVIKEVEDSSLTAKERLTMLEKIQDAVDRDRQVLIDSGALVKSECSKDNQYEHFVRKGDTLFGVMKECGYRIDSSEIFELNDTLKLRDILTFHYDANKTVHLITIDRVGSETIKLYKTNL